MTAPISRISVAGFMALLLTHGSLATLCKAVESPVPRPGRDARPESLEQLPPLQLAPPEQLDPPVQFDSQPTPRESQPPGINLAPNPSPTTTSSITIVVKQFIVNGSTVFKQADFDRLFSEKGLIGQPIPFSKVLEASELINQLYASKNYLTTGAYIPEQETGITQGSTQPVVITIQVVEGGLEDIVVQGLRRLQPNYIKSRIALATTKPLNKDRLIDALKLLRQNPLIQDIKAELAAGLRPGKNVLKITVTEARTFNAEFALDNRRSPSVGTIRRQAVINQANLLGRGDDLQVSYANTNGSHEGTLRYVWPLNPRNGTLSFNFGISHAHVIEEPFDVLDINSKSSFAELTYRQPIVQTPTREIALGATLSRQRTRTTLLDGEIPYPTLGADGDGIVKVMALRLFQEATWRSSTEILALRSQFSFGLGILGATVNDDQPDSRYVSWRGQAQWIKLLAPETTLLLRGDVQLSTSSLLSIEQFGIGGLDSVRGYRQDAQIGDSGLFASAEVRLPIWRLPKQNGLLQLAPFVDFGTVWNSNNQPNPTPRNLLSAGLGLRFQLGDRFSARLDWGVPILSYPKGEKRTLQENGLYFSLNYSLY